VAVAGTDFQMSDAATEVSGLAAAQPLRQRLGEQVAQLLLTAIRLHEFLPEERLPSEADLCAQLGVNRMAVREGLHWLEDHEYIRMQRGRYGGAFVLDPGLDLAVERVRGEIANLAQLFEYRAAVEPLAASLAASRIDESELLRLDRLHEEEMLKPPVSRGRFRAIDVTIHRIIAGACRNGYLTAAVKDIRVWLAPGLDLLGPSPYRRQESVDCHGELIGYLHAHDSAGAERAMRAHIEVTERAITSVMNAQRVRAASGRSPRSARSEFGRTDRQQ
jgi:GntR family transcriptional repressor for pyruvate dehydrogenase complex